MRSKLYEILLLDFTNPGARELCMKGHKSCLWDPDVGILVPHELDVLIWQVLAHNCSPVMAGGVVPLSVDDRHARLLSQSALRSESIRLRLSLVSGLCPLVHSNHPHAIRVETNWTVGGKHLDKGGSPKPSVDVQRLVMVGIAAAHLGITKPAGGPDLLDAGAVHEALDQVPLVLRLEGDQVHATLPAVVPCSEPVPFPLPQHLFVTLPVEPVGFVLEGSCSNLLLSDGTLLSNWKANLSPVAIGVDIVARGVFWKRDCYHPPSTRGTVVVVA